MKNIGAHPLPCSLKVYLLILVLSYLTPGIVYSQVEPSSKLYQQLAEADSLLFKAGFNNCEIPVVQRLIDPDLEFYHDVSGVQDAEEFMLQFKRNICSDANQKPIRQLVDQSLDVFKLEDNGSTYGAIQKGKHRFYIRIPGKELRYTGEAQFTHVWILREGEWKLKTALSYDH